MIAHILVAKYMMGLPFYRLEEKLAYDGACIDRGTMCRYAEDAGATLGAIVLAARDEAFATASASRPTPPASRSNRRASTTARDSRAARATSSSCSPIAITCSSSTNRSTRARR